MPFVQELERLDTIGRDLRSKKDGVKIGPHLKKLKQHDMSFSGSDAVDWLLAKGHVSSRDEGEKLGNAMINAGIFHHASDTLTKKKPFLDHPAQFYRFYFHDQVFAFIFELCLPVGRASLLSFNLSLSLSALFHNNQTTSK